MNNIYIYDGSFYSLISLIISLIIKNIKVVNIKSESEYIDNLLTNPVYLNVDNKTVVNKFIENNISQKIMKIIYLVYLSTDENRELIIYYFIKNALKYKDTVFYRTNLKCVNLALKLSKQVSRENHKLKGFLRFEELKNGVLFARFSPTNNVLSILAPHFTSRLKNENFLIKDEKRNTYAFYDKDKLKYLKHEDIVSLNLELSDNEKDIERLWKTFFDTVSIKERENKKVQMNFMPKKYWKYILEMEDLK